MNQNDMLTVGIEVAMMLLSTGLGYAAACCYLRGEKLLALPWRDLLPNTPSRFLYLAAELGSFVALIYMFQTVYKSEPIHRVGLLALVAFLFPIAAVDHRTQKIPNKFLLAALWARLAVLAVDVLSRGLVYGDAAASMADRFLQVAVDCGVGALVLGGFFLLIKVLFRGSLGMGDVKLFALIGLYQGLWGAINSLFFSLVAAFLLSILLMATRKKGHKDVIPFGPSVLVGTVIAIGLSGI